MRLVGCVLVACLMAQLAAVEPMIACGNGHTIYLADDGTIWGWGKNDRRQVVNTAEAEITTPRQLRSDKIWVAVAAGYNFTIALDNNGFVYAWGSNDYGIAGNNDGYTTDDNIGFTWCDDADLRKVKAIAAGSIHCLALLTDGRLVTWGQNTNGQLGTGVAGGSTSDPAPVDTSFRYRAIAAGGWHTLALTDDSRVRSWGHNSNGQCGRSPGTTTLPTPDFVVSTSGTGTLTGVRTLGAGAYNGYAVVNSGQLYPWGANDYGQLGDSATTIGTDSATPVIADASACLRASGGWHHSQLIRANGAAAVWGRNNLGQLRKPVDAPTDTNALQNYSHYRAMSVGPMASHVFMVDPNGVLWGWGNNNDGQLGTASPSVITNAFRIPAAWRVGGIVAAAAGQYHGAAVTSDGRAYGWGSNAAGQVGNGETGDPVATPEQVVGVSGAIRVECGVDFGDWSGVHTGRGDVFSWGENEHGQHGDNSNGNDHPTAVSPTFTDNVIQVAVGDRHMLLLDDDGTVFASGRDSAGQLGNDSNLVDQATPDRVMTSCRKVAAGYQFSMALRLDGTVAIWGDNLEGQLGLGTTGGNQPTPVTVPGLTGIIDIACGSEHALALKSNGELYAWGGNVFGQLGLGDNTRRTSPTLVTDGIIAIGGGRLSSYAINGYHQGLAWGSNHNGELGISGAGDEVLTPTQISTYTDFLSIDGGWRFAVGVRVDGSLVSWGDNSTGQLALGTIDIGFDTPQTAAAAWLPTVQIDGVIASANEDGKLDGRVRISRTGQTAGALSVSYTTDSTSPYATLGDDYNLPVPAGTVVIPHNQSSTELFITPEDDAIDENTEDAHVLLLADDEAYQLGTTTTADVPILDDDTAGIKVSPINGLETTEAGGKASFTIQLLTQPTEVVRIGLSSSNTGEGRLLSQNVINFAAAPSGDGTGRNIANLAYWQDAVAIEVTGWDDDVDDDDVNYEIITAAAVSGDEKYNNLNGPDVSIVNRDDDTAGFEFVGLDADVLERGLKLTTASTSGSVISFTGDPDLANVRVGMLVEFEDHAGDLNGGVGALGAGNVTVTAVDAGADTITVSVALAADTGETVLVGHESRGGVKLQSQPTAPVTLGIGISDPTEGNGEPLSLTFSAANWDEFQTVIIRGVDDAIDDGDIDYQAVTNTVESSDPKYNGLNPPDAPMTTIDDDARALIITQTDGTTAVTEGGAGDTYSIRLATKPTASLGQPSIDVDISVTSDATVSPSTVVFDQDNWDNPVTITVMAIDDPDIEPVENPSISHVIDTINSNGDYQTPAGAYDQNVNVTITSDDAAGVVVAPSSLLISEGQTADVTVVLTARPAADVFIPYSSNDTGIATVSGISPLQFTPTDWADPQTITVTANDDGLNNPGRSTAVVIGDPSSADSDFGDLGDGDTSDVVVNLIDDEAAGIRLLETDSGTAVAEDGTPASDTYRIALNSEITGSEIVVVRISAPGDVTVSPSTIVFTAANTGVGLDSGAITVTVIDDASNEAAVESVALSHAVTASSFTGYTVGMPLPDLTVQVTDDDVPGISLSPLSGLTTSESGGRASFSVVLDSQPASDVVIDFTPDDLTEVEMQAGSGSITFTASDWNVAQTVTVLGVDKDTGAGGPSVDDDDQPFTINGTISTGAGADYPVLQTLPPVTGLNLDDDTIGISLDAGDGLAVTEGTGTDSYSVQLDSAPTDVVTVAFNPDGQVELVSAAAVYFSADGVGTGATEADPRAWNNPFTVTIQAVEDAVAEDNPHLGRIQHAVFGADYNAVSAPEVTVTITDNDLAGIILTVHDEAGTTAALDSTLATDPSYQPLVVRELHTFQAFMKSDDLTKATGTIVFNDAVDDDFPASEPQNLTFVWPGQFVAIVGDGPNRGSEGLVTAVNDAVPYSVTLSPGTLAADNSGTIAEGVIFAAGFEVELKSKPKATVVVEFTSSDDTEGYPTPDTVFFTPENWNIKQRVYVIGETDFIDEDLDNGASPDVAFTVAPTTIASLDPDYNGLGGDVVNVVNRDDDAAGVTISPDTGTTPLTVYENGSTETFTVVLDSEPTADVTVPLAPQVDLHGDDQVTIDEASLTFTANNWYEPQTVTVTGLDTDLDDNGAGKSVIIASGALTSTDSTYGGLLAGAIADVNVDVLAVNNAPAIDTPEDLVIDEDAGLITVDLTGIGSGQAGEVQALTVTASSSDTNTIPNPTVVYTSANDTGSMSFTPVADLSGSVSITITVADDGGTANGGIDTTSVSFLVSISPVNDLPTVDSDGNGTPADGYAATFTEGGGPVAVVEPTLMALADVDNASLVSATVTLSPIPDGADEVLAVTVGGSGVTANYDSAAGVLTLAAAAPLPVATWTDVLRTLTYDNASGAPATASRSVSVVVNDGTDDSVADITTVTVSGVEFVPVVDLNGPPPGVDVNAVYTEDDGIVGIVDLGMTVTDPDSPTLTGATVTLTNGTHLTEVLAVNTSTSDLITAGWAPPVLTLTGTAPVSEYQSVLRTLDYHNQDQNLDATPRVVTVTVSDGVGTSAPASATISMTPVNDPPTVTANTGLTLPLGTSVVVTASHIAGTDADDDDASLSYRLLLEPGQGELQLDGVPMVNGDFFAPADLTAGRLIYIHDGLTAGSDGFAFELEDGLAASPLELFAITASGLVPPEVRISDATPLSWVEDAPPVQVDGALIYTDTDHTVDNNYSSATVTVTIAGGEPADAVTIGDLLAGQITLSASDVVYQGETIIGTWAGGSGGAALVVSLNANAEPTSVQALLRSLQFANASQNPSSGTRTISIVVDDGGVASVPGTRAVALVPVNDAPLVTPPTVLTVPAVDRDEIMGLSDYEGDALTVTVTVPPTKGTLTTIDPVSGAFTYSSFPAVSGVDSFEVVVTDDGVPNASTTVTVPISISDLGGSPAQFVGNSPMSVDEGTPLLYTPRISAVAAEHTLRFELVGLTPSGGLTFNAADGTISWAAVAMPLTGYYDFGLLLIDETSGTAAYQPILLHVTAAGPVGGG